MFDIGLYILVAYFAVTILLLALRKLLSPLKKVIPTPLEAGGTRSNVLYLLVFYGAACVLLISPLIPYGVVEVQTATYKYELIPPTRKELRDQGFPDRLRAFKVLAISSNKARVYAVVPCDPSSKTSGYNGVVLNLKRVSGRWQSNDNPDYALDGVWSDCGNADGNIFPPYPSDGDYK